MTPNIPLLIASALYLLTLLLIVGIWPRLETPNRTTGGIVFSLVGLLSLIHQYTLLITAEDAFIVFRYSRNLASGLGPVFNAGERVEGYSDFLWMVVLAAGYRWGGLDIPTLARVLGALAALLTLWLVCRVVSEAFPGSPAVTRPGLVAALLLGSSGTFATWASSGLETSLFTLLCTAVLLAALRGSWKVAGLLIAASAMTRPDGVLLLGTLSVWMLLDPRPLRERLRSAAEAVAAFSVVFVPWTLWRVAYYGDWLPNAVRAKQGLDPIYQAKVGVAYTIDFGIAHGVLFVLLSMALAGREARQAWVAPTRVRAVLWLVGLFVATLALFVSGVGGDWMPSWRMLMPVVGGMAAIVGILWHVGWPGGELRLESRAAISLLAITSCVLFGTSWSHAKMRPFVVRWAYMIDGLRDIGEWFGTSLPEDTLIATHPNGALSYYSRLPVIDMLGLTDRHIAVDGLKARGGRPGHTSYDYAYVARRRPLLVFSSGEGFEESPTARYLRPEFRGEYRAVCFRHPQGTNSLGQYVNLLILEQERERVIPLLLKDGRAEVVPCGPDPHD